MMHTDIDGVLAPLGLKYATLVGGFAGGVLSLTYVRSLTPVQMLMAVVTGTLSAGYLTPIVAHYVDMVQSLENGLSFIVGLTAMNVVPGIIEMSRAFKENPGRFFGRKNSE